MCGLRSTTLACVIVGAMGVASAVASVTGSGASLRLVSKILAHEKHVVAVLWRQHGGFYDCPRRGSYPRQLPGGRPPHRNCRLAQITFRQNLRNGVIMAEISTATARGFPTLTDVSTPQGEWVTYGRRRCWQRIGHGHHGVQWLTYDGDHVSIVGRRRRVVLLRDDVRNLGWEIETIDAHSYALLSDRAWQPIRGLGMLRTHSTFTYPSTPFTVPTVTPAC
jgi:hypothetical protein